MKDNSSTIVENGKDATIAAIPCYVPCGLELNKIYNESNLDTMKRMPDNFVDLTVTSPPYDNLREYKGYSFAFEDIAKELFRITKQGAVVVWVVADATINGSESGTSFKQALYFKEIGFKLHDTMIYHRHGRFPMASRYWQNFEYMFVFTKGKPKTFNAIKDEKAVGAAGSKIRQLERKNGDNLEFIETNRVRNEWKARGNVWYIPAGHFMHGEKIAFEHPATFPEKLANDHIVSWSNEGDLVYDPFMGSGTTAKMAILNNRKYIGSEISKEYCEIAEQRLKMCGGLLNSSIIKSNIQC
jgi:site-specific DNA-methyltransferase (adenine-specific)